MSQLSGLEDKLNKALVTDAPFQLPEDSKKWLVKYLPIINLVLGVFTLWSALAIWRWANAVDKAASYVNELTKAFGSAPIDDVSRFSVFLWLSLIMLAATGVLYIVAYPALKEKKKSGWNLLFYGALLNALYGVLVLFSDYGDISRLIGSVLGSIIGLYFLFQIRSHYLGSKASKPVEKKN